MVKVIAAYPMIAGIRLADETGQIGVIAAVRRVLGLNQRNSTDMGVLKHSWHSLKVAVLIIAGTILTRQHTCAGR